MDEPIEVIHALCDTCPLCGISRIFIDTDYASYSVVPHEPDCPNAQAFPRTNSHT